MFQKIGESRYIYDLRLYGVDLPLTHKQFVDDIILFGLPTKREVKRMGWIL